MRPPAGALRRVAIGALQGIRARSAVAAGLAVIAVVAMLAAHALAPYLFKRATLQSEIATQVRTTTGLTLSLHRVRFALLPRPHVVSEAVYASDPSGAVTLKATALEGEVRLLPLLVGRVELSGATLRNPRVTIELGGRAMPADSTIGRALHGTEGASGSATEHAGQRLGAMTLVDATVRLVDKARALTRTFANIDATVDWSDLDQPATVNGSLHVGAVVVELAAWIARPSDLLRGDTSAVVLHCHSPALELSTTGVLDAGAIPGFKGHVAANTPSLTAVLAAVAPSAHLPAPFAQTTLDGDIRVTMDHAEVATLDLHNLSLRADGNDYEGTLAYRGGGAPTVSATLAVERLALAPFLARMPAPLDAQRRWSEEPLGMPQPGSIGLDLRVSATQLQLPPFVVADAALAVTSRNDRLEIALIDGRLYGGTAKARLSMGAGGDLRGAGSLAGSDAAALSWDAFGRQLSTGTVSGSANLETHGESFAELIANLRGWTKTSVANGELSGLDLGAVLAASPVPGATGGTAAIVGGRTSFRSFTAAARVTDGVVTLSDAAMAGAGVTMSTAGILDVPARKLALRALAKATAPEVTNTGLGLALSGPFDAPALTTAPGALPGDARP